MRFESLGLGAFELGEGPVWDERTGVLSWVDITPGHLHTWDPATGERARFEAGQMLGAAAPRSTGGYVLALRNGIGVIDAITDSHVTWIAQGLPGDGHRFNDAKVDRAGRLWAGSIDLDFGSGPGSLYVIEPDGVWREALSDIAFPNGLGWSPDGGTMYLVDSLRHCVLAMDTEPLTGEVGEPRVHLDCSALPGIPDGLAVDSAGGLWIAHYGGGCLSRWAADGTLVGTHAVPADQPTCPVIMDHRVIVTTAAQNLDEPNEHDGHLIAAYTAARPQLATPFAG